VRLPETARVARRVGTLVVAAVGELVEPVGQIPAHLRQFCWWELLARLGDALDGASPDAPFVSVGGGYLDRAGVAGEGAELGVATFARIAYRVVGRTRWRTAWRAAAGTSSM